MLSDFGGITTFGVERLGEKFMESPPLLSFQRVAQGFADDVVSRGPPRVAQADEPGPGEGVQIVQHARLVRLPRNGQDACRNLPADQREHRQGFPTVGWLSGRSILDYLALPVAGRLTRQLLDVFSPGLPSTPGVGLDGTAGDEGPHDLVDGQRS